MRRGRPKIQVVSPMWPSASAPHIGIFVRNLSFALARSGFDVEPAALVRGKGRGRLGRARVHAQLGAQILLSSAAPADIVYVHAPSWFGPLSELVARTGDKRLVVHAHGGEVYPHSRVEALAQPLVRQLCRRADLVVSPSRYYADECSRAFDLDPARVVVSPSGGVDTALFDPGDRGAARDALRLPREPIFVGLFGRMEEDKGLDVFVATLAALRDRGYDARGLVVGRGGGLEALRDDARRRGVPIESRGIMPQVELRNAYRALDLFLFPTRRGAEALGLVSLEAMACGVPVIGSNAYAVPEYVEPGITGDLAPPDDPAAFARAAHRILDLDPAARAAMAAAARNAAMRFDARASADQLASRLHTLLPREDQTC